MTIAPTGILTLNDLAAAQDFRLGPLLVSPARRLVEGPAGARHLQPQIMLVFLCLVQEKGKVVTRRALFETCWGSAPVGDDSLNRALTAIRQVLEGVGAQGILIETIPRTGYRLVTERTPINGTYDLRRRRVQAAYDCWRSGYPEADIREIAALDNMLTSEGGEAREWGVFALLVRKAAEYADSAQCAAYVGRCEEAARQALELDPAESNARVALAGLIPLFGNWSNARSILLDILSSDPSHVPARHDLAILEMATGRPSAAIPIIERLIADDPLAASFHYKRMYHLWTIGDVLGAEQVAARALQLWPRHLAIWSARFWILIFTGRTRQALRLVADQQSRPTMPEPAAKFLQTTAELAIALQSDELPQPELWGHVGRTVEFATLGPAQAVSALTALCALGAIDQAFEVARGYYVGLGRTAVPLRRNADDPSITDQHRRVTQALFVPAAQRMREDERFLPLCKDMGLAAYWEEFGIVPDFLQSGVPASSTTAPPTVRE
jgi:DNA-binding winged helix-turn-helix (wHTH) protein